MQAVDRDLVYSEISAVVHLSIHPPYGMIILVVGLGLAAACAAVATGYGIRRRRDLFARMAKELQTAHELQMGLMPAKNPKLEGFDIAGRCVPATQVGGDFFQYFDQQDKLMVCLADVTGHAMAAAIPVVMFDGILRSEMAHRGSVEDLFFRLNRSLHQALDARTFVCFTMAELDPVGRTIRVSNGGCPYPYHYKAATGELAEVQIGAYPLGVRGDTEYPVIELNLDAGDRLVLCSDGITEAPNVSGEQLGYNRATVLIREACREGLSAESTIGWILKRVDAFRGDTPQSDDMACVVVCVESDGVCTATV